MAEQRSVGETIEPPAGFASVYADIAKCFGVSVSTIKKWKTLGAPIEPRQTNDLNAIWQWKQNHQAGLTGGSRTTSNHYLRAMKSFTAWLSDEGRIAANPFQKLSALKTEADVRRSRRTLLEGELQQLISTATNSDDVISGLPGLDRAMLYITAASTGLRASELASVRVQDLQLTGESPTIRVRAAYSKRRRDDLQPISVDLATKLQGWLESKSLSRQDTIWPGQWNKSAADMLQRDLVAANIPYVNDDGHVFDFHALRHQFISNLAGAGVHPKVAQQLARHSTIQLTMDRYTHVESRQTTEALERLPRIGNVRSDDSQPNVDFNPECDPLAPQLALTPAVDRPGQAPIGRDPSSTKSPSRPADTQKPNSKTAVDRHCVESSRCVDSDRGVPTDSLNRIANPHEP